MCSIPRSTQNRRRRTILKKGCKKEGTIQKNTPSTQALQLNYFLLLAASCNLMSQYQKNNITVVMHVLPQTQLSTLSVQMVSNLYFSTSVYYNKTIAYFRMQKDGHTFYKSRYKIFLQQQTWVVYGLAATFKPQRVGSWISWNSVAIVPKLNL